MEGIRVSLTSGPAFCFVYKAASYTIVCYTQTEGGDLCQILINKDP